jgi:hypothetical protein
MMGLKILTMLNKAFDYYNCVLQTMEENLARASQKNIDVWAGNEVEYRHRLEDLQREVKTVQVRFFKNRILMF